MSSLARRDSPNCRCNVRDALSTSLKAVWMLLPSLVPVAVSLECPDE